MTNFSRRRFLHGSGATALTLGVAPAASPLRNPLWQPNNELRVACVGIRSRGTAHIGGLNKLKDVKVVALVDVDRDVLAREQKKLAEGKGNPAGASKFDAAAKPSADTTDEGAKAPEGDAKAPEEADAPAPEGQGAEASETPKAVEGEPAAKAE